MTPSTILVVEDNPITRKLLRVALESGGYGVLEAEDGRSALELARRRAPDLILLDLILPGAGGVEVLGRLRDLPGCSEIPVLAIAGHAPMIEEARASSGFADLLLKPVEPSRLLRAVQDHLPSGEPAARVGAGRTVLIADDEPSQRKLLAFRLAAMGFKVVAAADGQEALDRARQSPPDAIVTDVLMPRLDGFGLAAAVRSDPRTAHVPVLLASSTYVEEGDRNLALKAGAAALVERTPDMRGVLDALLSSLGAPANPASPEGIAAEHAERLLRQLEKQLSLNSALARQCSLQAAELAVLGAIAEGLERTRDAERTLEPILNQCLDAWGISQGALYLAEPGGSPRLRAQLGYAPAEGGALEGFFGREDWLRRVMAERAPLVIPSKEAEGEPADEFLRRCGCVVALVVPVVAQEEPLGALFMASRTQDLPSANWLAFARTVGLQIGQAVALARAFSKVQSSEERFRALVENSSDVISLIGRDGTILYASGSLTRVLGYALAEFVGRDAFELVHPEDAADARKRFRERLESPGRPISAEVRYRHKDGSWRHLEAIGVNRLDDPNVGAVVVNFRDVTERIQAEEASRRQRDALYQSEKVAAMGTLLAGVAHELNNPLAVVMGQANLLLRRAGPGPLADRAEKIVEAAERCGRIVASFLALARQRPPERREVWLNKVVEEAFELLGYPLRVDDVEVRLALSADLPTLWADPHQLHQVVVNLVTNAHQALRAGPPPRRITAATRVERGRVVLEVADTGPGIPPEVRSRLFEPFFTTKPPGQGTGLGLSLCIGIVETHGGTLAVESEPGRGAVFRVELPVEAPPPEKARAPAAEEPAPVEGKAILIVDDEPALADMLADLLSEDGHRVDTAPNGAAALEKLAARPYDVVLSDIKMPVLDGPGLYREVERRFPQLARRFVFLTGDSLSGETREFLQKAARPTADKPVDFDDLRKAIREALAAR